MSAETFSGGDFYMAESTIIPRGGFGMVRIGIPQEALPSGPLSPELIRTAYSTGRSQIAQVGGDLRTASNQEIADAIEMGGFEGREVSYVPAQVRIDSHFTDLALDYGVPVGRLYIPGRNIEGEELRDLVSSKQIEIGNDKAWEFYYEPKDGKPLHEKNDEDIAGIVVRINAGEKFWIPPQKKLLRVRDLSSDGKEYRREIDKLLVLVPPSDRTQLWIGNTSVTVGMTEGIDAILDREVYSSITLKGKKGLRGKHINARLLDGGRDWLIRVEILGPTTRDGDNFIILRFKEGVKKVA